MNPLLLSLRYIRADVQARIEEERARHAPDYLTLTALKKLGKRTLSRQLQSA